MPFLLFLLILIFIFPWIFLPLFLFFILIIILLPYGFTIYSLFNLIEVPKIIYKIASKRIVRKNHALEHATINVIEERYGERPDLSGLAREDGFIVRGSIDPEELFDAAKEGLRRLKRGELSLAVHPRCGTSILVGNFVFSLIFLILLFVTHTFSIWNVFAAFLLSAFLGRMGGELIQRYFTTDPHVEDMEIIGIDYDIPVFNPFITLVSPVGYLIKTDRYRRAKIIDIN
ncbi:MAG TPA: hypothetical protein EYP16_07515 [Candidatus Atribacteria bacterium]|nr:hypothetical protein [Candidatus Atribacteria bacterium]